MADFTMPSLGADMEEGTLLEWRVAPGDTVHRGDIVAVVDTAKAAVEVETFVEGVVGDLLVEPGVTVAVGSPLATIEATGERPAPAAPPAVKPAGRPAVPPVAPPAVEPVAPPPAEPAIHSPLVRRLADKLGVDLAAVSGTGRGGTITRDDVTRAAAGTAPAQPPRIPPRPGASARVRATPYARRLATEQGIDLSVLATPSGRPVRAEDLPAARPQPPAAAPSGRQDQMRAAIAALMTRAKREIPHYYLSTTVDLDRALSWMHERNLALPVTQRIVPAAMMLKATALAAAESPELNGFWVDGRFQPATAVHLGVAVSLRGGGLVAPALHDATDLGLDELMAGMRDLVSRARSGRLRSSEMSDPTLTVTNLGDQGVESVQGVIYPPQVALVGFGRVVERPWAVDGMLGVRPVTTVTLAADHRATDGFTGSRFLARIDQHLQQPEDL